MAIIFISAIFTSRSRGADALDWLPCLIIILLIFMFAVNIIKAKLGFSPMFKKTKSLPIHYLFLYKEPVLSVLVFY